MDTFRAEHPLFVLLQPKRDADMINSMLAHYDNVMEYAKIGCIPFDKENESVSKTLEYAYDDYCIAQTAKKLGKDDTINIS